MIETLCRGFEVVKFVATTRRWYDGGDPRDAGDATPAEAPFFERRAHTAFLAVIEVLKAVQKMASKLSSEEVDEFRKDVEAAEPYPDDAPEFDTLDGPIDYARVRATLAKEILERHNIPLKG